jgi:hypothetical protein
VMAKRLDRGSVKLLCSLGKPRAKPDGEMSSDLANHHQGQQWAKAQPAPKGRI